MLKLLPSVNSQSGRQFRRGLALVAVAGSGIAVLAAGAATASAVTTRVSFARRMGPEVRHDLGTTWPVT
jgi:hypothetical protein